MDIERRLAALWDNSESVALFFYALTYISYGMVVLGFLIMFYVLFGLTTLGYLILGAVIALGLGIFFLYVGPRVVHLILR